MAAETTASPRGSAVAHPAHYNVGKIEVIDAIEEWQLNFNRGNAVKYTARAGHKDPAREVEDLEKAVWHLQRDITRLRKAADAANQKSARGHTQVYPDPNVVAPPFVEMRNG